MVVIMDCLDEPILGCACGQDHEVMPVEDLGDGFVVTLVCREHKRHEPCRRCLSSDPEFRACQERLR